MVEFSFTASAECERCGHWLSSSDESCDLCVDEQETRWHFVNMSDSDDVQLVWAISPLRAWAELQKKVPSVLPYRLYERGLMSLHYKQAGYDVTDPDDLRRKV